MPSIKSQLPEIVAEHLAGGIKSYAVKTIKPTDLRACRNVRSNEEGGRYPRPGYEDSGIDLSSFSFTAGRAIFSAKSPERLWIAGDNGSNTKICYVDTDLEGAQYGTVFDVGLTLQTGYYVTMMEWWGDIYYGNGYDTVGRIVVSQVDTGGVAAGSATLNLSPGSGVRFAASGTGKIGTDTFTWTGKSGDQLTGVSGILAHNAGEIVTVTTTLSPNYCDKATILFEWLASFNILGDPEQPFVWEFSKFANAGSPSLFYDFSGSPSGTELVGEGGKITGALSTKNYGFVWKSTGMYATARSTVNTSNGARIPEPIKKGHGAANPRCIATVGDDDVVWLTPEGRIERFGATVQNGTETVGVDTNFDGDISKELEGFDPPGDDDFVHFNEQEQLLKVAMHKDGVKYIWVKDYSTGQWFLDDNKNFDVMCQHEGKSWAFDGNANKLYVDEFGNYDDTVPVDAEWLTGRLGNPAFYDGKGRYARLHGYMTQGSIVYFDFYKNGTFIFTKTLDDSYITSLEPDDGVTIGHSGIGTSKSIGSGGSAPTTYPFRFPVGMNHRAEDFSIKMRSDGLRGDFVQVDGFRIGVRPLSRFPHKHA